MSRTIAILGFVAALALAAIGAELLVSPSEAAAPPAQEQIAPASLELPEDRVPRTHLVSEPAAPVTLSVGTRVRIARLRIDLPIEMGDSVRDIGLQSTPATAAYLLPGSAVPGALGNAYVYAHARPGLFIALWNVRLGDVVEIDQPPGVTLRYVVTEIHPRVDPSDLRYLEPSEDERLTLQTSTGSWTLSPRFVVVARPVR